ncbi:MAG TPA: hypothetical protein VEL07_05410 [Planctomycetota bacterium]|nr:hypothetical protein [Planctomycetota bacterium]
MRIGAILLAALGIAALGAATDDGFGLKPNDSLLRPMISAQEQAALERVREVEKDLERIAALPPRERLAREAKLEDTLTELLEDTRGTKHQNRALYWLAAWQLDYADGEGTAELLAQLERSEYPSFKHAGQFLRVRLLCQQGRIDQARAAADALVREVPEFAIASAVVGFHERVGTAAPRPPAKNLGGGPSDPAAGRDEPWLVYLFVDGVNPLGLDRLRTLARELAEDRYAGRVRLVCIAFGANPIETLAAVNEAAEDAEIDVLWPNPSDGSAQRWREEWSLPGLPASALIGPDRTIMAAQPTVDALRSLVGKRGSSSRAKPRADEGDQPRGKGPAWQK